MKPAAVAIVYALVMLGAGIYAYSSAPDPAKATTGLVIPGVCAAVMTVMAIIIASARGRARSGAIAVRTAIVLAAVFAAAFSVRAVSATSAEARYQEAAAEYDAAAGEGSVAEGEDARREFLAARGVGDHSKAYLRNTLWILVGASAVAAIGLALAAKPGAPKRD